MVIWPKFRARKSDAFRSRRRIFLSEVTDLLLERASRVFKIRTRNILQRGSWGLRNGETTVLPLMVKALGLYGHAISRYQAVVFDMPTMY